MKKSLRIAFAAILFASFAFSAVAAPTIPAPRPPKTPGHGSGGIVPVTLSVPNL